MAGGKKAPAVPNPNALGSLAVVIVDDQGLGIPGARAKLHRPATNDDVDKLVDKSGTAVFDKLPPGNTYVVTASARGFGPEPQAPLRWKADAVTEPNVVVEPGPERSDITFQLRKNTAKLTVKVIDATTNLPLAGASVGIDGVTGAPMPLSAVGTGVFGPTEVPADTDLRVHAEKLGFGPLPGGTPLAAPADAHKTLAFNENFTQELRLHQTPLITPKIDLAKLVVVVKKAHTKPARKPIVLSADQDFDGHGILKATGGGAVKLFDQLTNGTEIPLNRQYTGAELKAGFKVFVEGVTASTSVNSLVLELVLSGGTKHPSGNGKITITVVELTLDICKARTSKTVDPVQLSEADKVGVGAFMPRQAANSHARVKLIVQPVKPADFTGTLELTAKVGGGTVRMFRNNAEMPKAGQPVVALTHEFAASTVGKGLTFFLEGDTVSTALRDGGLNLGVKGVEPDGDHVQLTVYQVTKIDATQFASPCRGVAGTAMAVQTSNTNNHTFSPSDVAIVRGSGDLLLTTAMSPAVVPISWRVIRAPDDHASLTGLPTHAADGAVTKRKMTPDAVGSFHVEVFHDDTGTGAPDLNDQPAVFNVSVVDIEVVGAPAAIHRDTRFKALRSTGNDLVVDSGNGSWNLTPINAVYTDAMFTQHAFATKTTVNLIGGGANKRRGTDRVRLGSVQVTTADSVVGTYGGGRTLKEFIALNPVAAVNPAVNAVTAGTPAPLPFPVRDTRDPVKSGDGVFIISSSDAEKTNLPTGGLRRVVRYIDSPAIVLSKRHPVTATPLASIAGTNDFAYFISAYSLDYNENYVVVANGTWSASYGTYATPPPGPPPPAATAGWTRVGATITASAVTVHKPPVQASAVGGFERCPPNFVDNLVMDAR